MSVTVFTAARPFVSAGVLSLSLSVWRFDLQAGNGSLSGCCWPQEVANRENDCARGFSML